MWHGKKRRYLFPWRWQASKVREQPSPRGPSMSQARGCSAAAGALRARLYLVASGWGRRSKAVRNVPSRRPCPQFNLLDPTLSS